MRVDYDGLERSATTNQRDGLNLLGHGSLIGWESFIQFQIELQDINSRFSEYPKLPAFCVRRVPGPTCPVRFSPNDEPRNAGRRSSSP